MQNDTVLLPYLLCSIADVEIHSCYKYIVYRLFRVLPSGQTQVLVDILGHKMMQNLVRLEMKTVHTSSSQMRRKKLSAQKKKVLLQ